MLTWTIAPISKLSEYFDTRLLKPNLFYEISDKSSHTVSHENQFNLISYQSLA
jgi:hypothetical protein